MRKFEICISKAWSKYKWHITPLIILITSIVISLCLIANDVNKAPLSLSVLGSGFVIFQFWIREINIKRRREYDLRIHAYKELNDSIQIIFQIYNTYAPQKEDMDVKSLDSSMRNQINIIFQMLGRNIIFLFKNIEGRDEYNEINKILMTIINETNAFKNRVEKRISNKDESNGRILDREVWNQEMKKNLKQLYNSQNRFCRLLETYLT